MTETIQTTKLNIFTILIFIHPPLKILPTGLQYKCQGNTRDNGLASFEVKSHPYGELFWVSQSFETYWPLKLKGAMFLGNQGFQSCLAGGINVDHDRIVMVR